MALLNVNGLKKVYTTRLGGAKVTALSGVSFTVEEGEFVAIMGESGSGKTTLLNILAGLDKPTSGQVFLNMRDIVSLNEKEISAFRRDHLGFVFQDFNLLDTFSLQDNIFLPLVLAGKKYDEMKPKPVIIMAYHAVVASACGRLGRNTDRKSTRQNSSHIRRSRMPSSA